MADPTADDEHDEAPVDDADASPAGDAEAEEAPGEEAGTGKARTGRSGAERRRPVDPRADVAARRAATKARMESEAKGGEPAAKATADDPTGAKARRRAKAPAAAGRARADDPTGAKARREAASGSGKVARPSKRTGGAAELKAARSAARSGNPKKAATAAESSRYTAPIPRSQLESPAWVPVLMFTLLGLGGIVILLTYVLWNGRPLSLGVGLALILGGILTATQYR